jgi:hypothetical protein
MFCFVTIITALTVVFHIILGFKLASLVDEFTKKNQAKQYAQMAIEHASSISFQYNVTVCGKNNTCVYTSIVVPDNKNEIAMSSSSQFCYFCGNYINVTHSGLYKKAVLCRCN